MSLLAGACVYAQESRIAVVIDDVGNQLAAGRRSVALPGPVVLAILPHTPFADTLADEAAALGKEILIHMPMQASRADADPGPGSLALSHDPAAMEAALADAITAVPHAIGVSNHMGSLLTRDPLSMRLFMQLLASRNNLLFLDSYTTHLSVGLMLAREHGIPALKRDVFLDADPSVEGLEAAWSRLLQQARTFGFAIGIAHPYQETLDFLELHIGELVDIELVSLRELLSGSLRQRSYAELIGSVPTADFLATDRMH